MTQRRNIKTILEDKENNWATGKRYISALIIFVLSGIKIESVI